MSASKCARCELTVYPVEGLNCLDKIWHKGCFKCHECNMTLNMKNYKGYDKKPYCNAHCPQAKATTVADTPEIRRLAENTRIQSQAKYHEDFERSKGKGFTAIADDPETVRIKNTSKIISNVAYHGELERKKQMEEKRGLSGSDDHMNNISNNNNNNLSKQQNRMRDHSAGPRSHENDVPQNMANNFHNQQQPLQQNIMLHQQQQQHLLKQQQQQQQLQKLHHQQQQHQQQQQIRAQDNNQSMTNRHSQHLDIQQHPIAQQQPIAKQQVLPQQYPPIHPNQHHQQMIMRQQQQQMMMQRHSMDSSLAMNRQLSKQSLNNNHNPNQQQQHQQQQQLIRHQMMQNQSQSQLNQYLPINDSPRHQPANPMAVAGIQAQQMMNPSHLSGQRVGPPNPSGALLAGPQGVPHHLPHGYNNHPPIGPMMNGGPLPKQPQQQQYAYNPSNRQMPIHPSQLQQINHHHQQQQQQQQQAQIRPQQMPIHQMPRRVFRAMYDYVANDVDEVSFFENDILIDCVNVDGNWLIGKVARSGQTGMLPANYVAEISG